MNISFTGTPVLRNQIEPEVLKKHLNSHQMRDFQANLGAVIRYVNDEVPNGDRVEISCMQEEGKGPIIRFQVDIPDELEAKYPSLRNKALADRVIYGLQTFATGGQNIIDIIRTSVDDAVRSIHNRINLINSPKGTFLALDRCMKAYNPAVIKSNGIQEDDIKTHLDAGKLEALQTRIELMEDTLTSMVRGNEFKGEIVLMKSLGQKPATFVRARLTVPSELDAKYPGIRRHADLNPVFIETAELADMPEADVRSMLLSKIAVVNEELNSKLKDKEAQMKTIQELRELMITDDPRFDAFLDLSDPQILRELTTDEKLKQFTTNLKSILNCIKDGVNHESTCEVHIATDKAGKACIKFKPKVPELSNKYKTMVAEMASSDGRYILGLEPFAILTPGQVGKMASDIVQAMNEIDEIHEQDDNSKDLEKLLLIFQD